ncbi:scavenger receptor cysteine-rich domain-containing protein DMBT1-like [Centroberyx gerrardi]
MGCGPAFKALGTYFGVGAEPALLDSVKCSGQESSLTQCEHSGFGIHSWGQHAANGVICSGPVRLVNGTSHCSGRVEVYYNDQWGTVCGDDWGMEDAEVVCRQLSCGRALRAINFAYFGEGSEEIWISGVKCSGLEKSLSQCPHNRSGSHSCSHSEDAGVVCSASVRLVDGPDRCSGRVEVNHDGRWGTVCDDDWDLEDAQVVCREMECGTAQSAKRRAYFGAGTGKIWMNKLKCSGTEGFLKECSHRGFRRHDCGHHQDAGVICSAAVRLVNGTGRCSGRVEVYRHGQWGTVCGKNWDMMEAEVVCLELGCGTALDYKRYSFFGEGSGDIWMSGVMCDGHEDSVLHCHYDGPGTETCGHHQDAGVICSESEKVRLADGPDVCIGRVEVYSKGQWGTVCDDGWDLNEADVVCRELGCGLASEVKLGAFYGPGSGDILMTDVNCTGSEGSLTKCPHSRLGKQKCGHHEDAGVVCAESAKARLVNGRADGCSGGVEVYIKGQWGSVASFGWDMKDAEVVCREVGCGKAESVDYKGKFGQSGGQFGIRDVACSGEERSLIHCPHRRERFERQYIGVICSGPVRLVSGNDECSGRVEVYKYGEWGTVCDDDWDMKEAEVVCRQLNCGRALYVKQRAHFGKGSGEIWMSGVKCTGSVHVRLVNGTSRCSGRVEVFHDGQWGRVDDDGWDLNEAKVVCRKLGCGKALDAKNNSHFGQGSGEIWMTDVKCSGLESSLIQCSHLRPKTWTNRQDAGVVCSGSSEVRLVNGSQCSGRVEVYHDAMWRPVCDDNWDLNDGHVVCRELDCGEAVTVQREAYFGSGGRTNRLLEPGCSGNESSITQCPNKRNYVYGCTYREDAGLICSGNVRLVNGYDQCSGRVEVYRSGQWGTVCDDDWDTTDAEVVCRELGCGRPLNVKDQSYFGEGAGEVLLTGLTCSGSEDSLLQCPHDQSGPRNCGHHQDVGVICTESVKVRLVNGSDRCSGRVEVYYNGQWGAVCGDDWDMKDAEVVCREAVCGRAQSVGDDYGQGSEEHWLDGLECLGNESSLTQCSHKGFGRHECRHTVNAAVRCSAMVRLAGGGPCHGRVEVYHDGDWGTVCSSNWDMNNAAVVCRELDCRTPMS